MQIDIGLKQFATERQAQIIDAINEHGSQRKAADALGIVHGTISGMMDSVKRRAALQGYAPEADMKVVVPSPFVIKGTSTLYKDGIAKIQWVKTRLDDQLKEQAIQAAYEAMADELPRLAPIQKPLLTHEKLCNLYTITDFHMGMLANERESGADWDLKIAEATLIACFEQSIASTPQASVAFIN
jgi:hypothetical protein